MTDNNPDKNPLTVLRIELESIVFLRTDGDELREIGRLAISPTRIAEDVFRNEIPSEYEVEYAINSIEDELMKHRYLEGEGGTLVCNSEQMKGILTQDGQKEAYSRQDVENLFSRYAMQSMGRSPALDTLEINRMDYAALLILREIMHHYNYDKYRKMR